MTTDDHFLIPVTVMMPQAMLARIQSVARKHEAAVSPLIVELVRRQLILGATVAADTPTSDGAHRGGSRTYKRWTPELTAQLRELHAQGLSDGAIAKRLGSNQPTISKRRRDLQLPAHFAAGPDRTKPALAEGVVADAS